MDLLEMAFTRKKAEAIVTGLERPLNRHLVKLIGFDAPAETRAVWKKELKQWLREIAAIRLKPSMAKLKAKDIFEWLYDEPFGGVEVLNTRFLMADSDEDFLAIAAPEAVAQQLREFHTSVAPRLADGDACNDSIDVL